MKKLIFTKELYKKYIDSSTLAECEKVEEEIKVRLRNAFTDTSDDDIDLLFALGILKYNKDNE